MDLFKCTLKLNQNKSNLSFQTKPKSMKSLLKNSKNKIFQLQSSKNILILKKNKNKPINNKKSLKDLSLNIKRSESHSLNKTKTNGVSLINLNNINEPIIKEPQNIKKGYLYKNHHTRNIVSDYLNKPPLPQLTQYESFNSTTNSNNNFDTNINNITCQKNFLQYTQAISLYNILGRKREEFIRNYLSKGKHSSNGNITKGHFGSLMRNSKSVAKVYIPLKERHCLSLYNFSFNTKAAGNRYEKNMEKLLNLKTQISKSKDENNIIDIIKSFLISNGIYDNTLFTNEKINTFKQFLYTNFHINPYIQFKDFLINALNGNYNNNYYSRHYSLNNILTSKSKKNFTNKSFQPYNTDINFNIDIKNNLRLQKRDNDEKEQSKYHFDLIHNPKESIIKLEKDLQCSNCISVSKEDKDYISKMDIVRKKGKLLEMICLQKAQKQHDLNIAISHITSKKIK